MLASVTKVEELAQRVTLETDDGNEIVMAVTNMITSPKSSIDIEIGDVYIISQETCTAIYYPDETDRRRKKVAALMTQITDLNHVGKM